MKINEFTPDNRIFDNIGFEKKEQKTESSGGFGEMLKQKLDEVNSKQVQADDTTQKFITGEEKNVHKVMLDTEEAKMSLELAVQIRNKFVEAYQELSRTQL